MTRTCRWAARRGRWWCPSGRGLPHVHAVLAARLPLVALGEGLLLEPAPGGVLPLRLGREALPLPRDGVGPADLEDRMIRAPVQQGPRSLGVGPVGSLHLPPPRRR